MSELIENIKVAEAIIEDCRNRDNDLQFRIETFASRNSIKLSVIKNYHVEKVITIIHERVTKLDIEGDKNNVNKD